MSAQSEVRQKPGRRRDPACDDAIRRATLAEFVEHGYAGLSIEGVAGRARVGKATIYRRYQNKAELVVDAIRASAGIDDRLPDTGDVRADLTTMLRSLYDRLHGPSGRILVAFAGERARHPELAAEFERSVIGDKRRHVQALLRAAVERGEIAADADLALVAEAGPALLWHHAIHGLTLNRDLPERIVSLVLAAAGVTSGSARTTGRRSRA